MGLKEILEFRRAVRNFSNTEQIDTARVRQCLELAQLAPSSSNMQLYEFYHITDKNTLQSIAKACLGQSAATSAQEMVVFVTRQDLVRQRAKTMLAFEQENIAHNSPPEKQEKRLKQWKIYYGTLIPDNVLPFLRATWASTQNNYARYQHLPTDSSLHI